MTVLTLAGKPINWAKPPKPTDMVMWSHKSMYGKQVTGSFRHICHLDHLNALAFKKYGRGIVIIQTAFNKSVLKSKGTHDYDMCEDAFIPGVAWAEQQKFFRANGAGAYWRTPAQGFSNHIHWFTLPQHVGQNINDDYKARGFKVGYLIDGGWSSRGKVVSSSQIEDYYEHKNALVGHAHDSSWFPPNIEATIFSLTDYVHSKRGPVIASPAIPTVSAVHALMATAPASTHVVAVTSNLMALPKNPRVGATLNATPEASVIMVQEANLFHNQIQHVPGFVTAKVPKGQNYSTFVLYRPEVWDHVLTYFPQAYVGHHGISLTRHIAVTVLRNKALGFQQVFISYHSVTAGKDKIRKRMRRQGDAAVRRELTKYRKAGLPITVGCDQNRTGNVFRSRNAFTRHRIDAQYTWSGAQIRLAKTRSHTTRTRSDHDALVVYYNATKK